MGLVAEESARLAVAPADTAEGRVLVLVLVSARLAVVNKVGAERIVGQQGAEQPVGLGSA